ncbi:N-acetylmuramoyl-L-alanine amidase [Mucilaginibacter sp. Bleaf8]|uniref:N-acetylmuramoyl-L-alanine amidase n=1 Tax=Mucilaginibacter sp. Bleaf8 TaxID=2834430 RepID=UPI001BD0B77E|nr:N-acetylmuramoyl-L-alanine amidase [Mucilaginibacter sp. Bleaf8]MBS7565852.1 N-acetylmuramoyl-L-alanine amidase [Mucilaginibacter sp. Bleaf8]
MKLLRPSFYLLLLTILFASCKAKKPGIVTAVDNKKVYKSQIDSFLDIAKQMQPVVLADSLGAPIPSDFVGTVNFNLRKPNYVILHHTAQDSLAQTIRTFSLVRTQVSAHYVVGRDGKVVHMLNDYLRSWHAGVSKWGNVTDMNSCSIGIEIDNNGIEPFSDAQMKSLLTLLSYLKNTYNIPAANFIGHSDIAPGRKTDPSARFPWKTLADRGFGYWSDDILELAPENFDYATALRLMGYDTHNLSAAIKAFKLHFIQTDVSPQLSQLDLNVLYNVYKKY